MGFSVEDLPSFNLFFNGGKVGVKIKRVYSLFSISDRCLVNIITGFLHFLVLLMPSRALCTLNLIPVSFGFNH